MKKILIIGVTSAIAKATARIWAKQGSELFLVARNQEGLDALTQDLKVRHVAIWWNVFCAAAILHRLLHYLGEFY